MLLGGCATQKQDETRFTEQISRPAGEVLRGVAEFGGVTPGAEPILASNLGEGRVKLVLPGAAGREQIIYVQVLAIGAGTSILAIDFDIGPNLYLSDGSTVAFAGSGERAHFLSTVRKWANALESDAPKDDMAALADVRGSLAIIAETLTPGKAEAADRERVQMAQKRREERSGAEGSYQRVMEERWMNEDAGYGEPDAEDGWGF